MSTCSVNCLQRNAGDGSACQGSSGTDQKGSGKTCSNVFLSVNRLIIGQIDEWTNLPVDELVSGQMGQ